MTPKIGQMRWIGLTGGIASGKSTVAYLLRNKGIPVVDADEISRHLTAQHGAGLKSIVRYFGSDIVSSEGDLDRKKLGAMVFSDAKKLSVLENILHPMVQAEVLEKRKSLVSEGVRFAFYDVPLLFEKNLQPQFDAIVVVSADLETQKQRLKLRNNLSDNEVLARIQAQLPMSVKEKQADFVINNHGSMQDLENQVNDLIEKLETHKFSRG